MKKELMAEIECIECGKVFKVDISNIRQEVYEYNGERLTIVSTDCQDCGKRHYVQIDNEESEQLKVKNLLMFKKLSKKKLSGGKIGKLDNNTFKDLRQKLLDLRTELMKEYEGKEVTNTETGEKITIHFTVC